MNAREMVRHRLLFSGGLTEAQIGDLQGVADRHLVAKPPARSSEGKEAAWLEAVRAGQAAHKMERENHE